MAQINFAKENIPFLLGGTGKLSVDTGALQLTHPIPQDATALITAGFGATGDRSIALGQAGTVKVAVSTDAKLQLVPIFANTADARADALNAHGIEGFFANGANADKLVLYFDAGAAGAIAAAGSFSYSVLKATITVKAGADGGYAYLRAFDKTLSLQEILSRFFAAMRLPEQAARAPEPGEAIALRYGGYLKLSAEASAGYQLAGTKSFSMGEMVLSEKYDLSILGKVGLKAGIAGDFSILVTAAEELPGWARVRVRRHRAGDIGVAADVQVGFKNEMDSLPPAADEFLGAALGVNAKSFLNVFQKARELADFDQFKRAIDGLAKKYIAEYTGKAFDQLAANPEFNSFLGRVNQAVKSYQEVGDRAVTLFDRYFDRLANLTAFLERIQALEAKGLDTLRKDLDPQLWNMLSQLTDGDPLGFLLQQVTVGGKKIDTVPELRARATAALSLVRDEAHAEIRNMVALAKRSFGVDAFFSALARIDTVDELRALANDKVGDFVSRLVGRTLDSSANLKQAFKEIKAVLDKIDSFKAKLYDAFKAALNSSYKVALHAEYSRASERDSLVDVLVNMSDARGAGLLAAAGTGDFEQLLAVTDTGLVRLREGVLTHRTRRETAFKVNIAGWHLNYNYEGFDRVITEAEQRLVPSGRGIQVLTTADLTAESLRKRQGQEMHVNFLLRALGESAKAVKSDGRTSAYVIDALTSLTARYRLAFTDDETSASELRDYLAFAADLGLDSKGARFEALERFLPREANGGFGRIETSYDVRFGERAVQALLQVKQLDSQAEHALRNAMRRMLLANYLRSDALHDVAFAYATDAVFLAFMKEGFAAFGNHSQRQFPVRLTNARIPAPSTVTLNRTELAHLVTLFNIENSLIAAIQDLYVVLHSQAVDPRTFEKKLQRFGGKLQEFDKFDQTTGEHGIGTNTIFAMFDALVRLASARKPANAAVLQLKSRVNGREVEKLFLSDDAAEVVVPAVSSASVGGGSGA